MRRALLLLLALGLLVAPAVAAPAPLAVRAVYAGDGARVSWPRVAGAAVVSIGRPGGRQPLGRPVSPTATVWRQGRGSLDVNLALRPGDAVEVRVWDARGELLAVGEERLRWAVYLPVVRR